MDRRGSRSSVFRGALCRELVLLLRQELVPIEGFGRTKAILSIPAAALADFGLQIGSFQHFCGIDNRCELFVKIAESRGVHVFRGTRGPIQRTPRKGRGRVGNHVRSETEISRHSRRSRNAMVRREPNDHERVNAILTKVFFKVRSNKSTVHVLTVNGFSSIGQGNRLNRMARHLWTQETVGLRRIMNDVSDRAPAASPGREKPRDVRLRLRIVSLPQTRIEERLLYVDDN